MEKKIISGSNFNIPNSWIREVVQHIDNFKVEIFIFFLQKPDIYLINNFDLCCWNWIEQNEKLLVLADSCNKEIVPGAARFDSLTNSWLGLACCFLSLYHSFCLSFFFFLAFYLSFLSSTFLLWQSKCLSSWHW